MVVGDDGTPRLRESPPLLQHTGVDAETKLVRPIGDYVSTVPADVAVLLSHFRVTDLALRVVGVGSVGTRCYLAILTGPDGTPLVLQIKEADRSVLEEYGGIEQPRVLWGAVVGQGHGARVVYGQGISRPYSHPSTRAALRRRGIKHTIPERDDQIARRKAKGSSGGRPPAFDAAIYKQRNTVERGFNRLKQWRGVAARYDKSALTFLGGVLLASSIMRARTTTRN